MFDFLMPLSEVLKTQPTVFLGIFCCFRPDDRQFFKCCDTSPAKNDGT